RRASDQRSRPLLRLPQRLLRQLSFFDAAGDAEHALGMTVGITEQCGVRLDPHERAILPTASPLEERRLATKCGEMRSADDPRNIVLVCELVYVTPGQLLSRVTEDSFRRRREVEGGAVELLETDDIV